MRADAEGSGEAAGGRKVAAALLGALRADGHASRSAEALYAMWEHAFDEAEALQVELTKLRELPPPPAVGEEQASRRTLSAPPRSNPSARISRSPTAPAPARSAAPTATLLRRRQLAVQRAELEDLRARLEVSKAQIGGLVYEKGVLNGSLRKRDAELRELAEEKARPPLPSPSLPAAAAAAAPLIDRRARSAGGCDRRDGRGAQASDCRAR